MSRVLVEDHRLLNPQVSVEDQEEITRPDHRLLNPQVSVEDQEEITRPDPYISNSHNCIVETFLNINNSFWYFTHNFYGI